MVLLGRGDISLSLEGIREETALDYALKSEDPRAPAQQAQREHIYASLAMKGSIRRTGVSIQNMAKEKKAISSASVSTEEMNASRTQSSI